jgi:hypothetical protein
MAADDARADDKSGSDGTWVGQREWERQDMGGADDMWLAHCG